MYINHHCVAETLEAIRAKQGVNAIIVLHFVRQKASVCFDFFKGLRGNTFLCRGKNKNVQLETLSVYRRPLRVGVRSLPPQTKNPRYGPDSQRIGITMNNCGRAWARLLFLPPLLYGSAIISKPIHLLAYRKAYYLVHQVHCWCLPSP